MINYLKKDITTVERGVIGHGCNAVGGFGSGVAGAIRKKWPIMYHTYKADFEAGILELDFVHAVRIGEGLHVCNMVTQQNCGYDGARYADENAIANTMNNVVGLADTYKLPLYVPKIGCGLGGLDYEYEVRSIYEYMAGKYPDVEINVCEL